MEEAILRIQPIIVLILKIQKSLRISDLQSMATESSSAIQFQGPAQLSIACSTATKYLT